MNNEVEDLLREGMERFTRDLRAPAGLIRRAERRRHRRLALRSAAGATAALAAAVAALVAVMVPGADHNGTEGPAVNTAYVLKQIDSALGAAEPGQIAHMTVATRGAAPPFGTTASTSEEWSYGDQWRSVTYSSAGHPVYDGGMSASSVYTLVTYRTRTWARQTGLGRPAGLKQVGSGPRGCVPAFAGLPLLFPYLLPDTLPGVLSGGSPATVARDLRTAVSCGSLADAGRKRVDGIDVIELTSRPGSLLAETIWVSPSTYLPVRVVARRPSGAVQTADITWLPRTAQNLARLTVPIPAGFRQVPITALVKPTLRPVPGGPQP